MNDCMNITRLSSINDFHQLECYTNTFGFHRFSIVNYSITAIYTYFRQFHTFLQLIDLQFVPYNPST